VQYEVTVPTVADRVAQNVVKMVLEPIVPTVADRVAQNVVKMVLEPIVERQFHPESYGYRPGRSAHDAVARASTFARSSTRWITGW
jgi:retron-type reverse transcriptase